MKPTPSMIERMAEAYWNAFRDGYIAVGGRPESYPTWQQSNDPQKDETIRCLRHAVEVLRDDVQYLYIAASEVTGSAKSFDDVFPDDPQPRKLRPTPTDEAFLRQTDMGKAFDA